jgi:hypothetical protein
VTQYPNRRNPIVRHGELGQQFVQIPNDLARDTNLSLHAYKIAIVMRTHRQGWEISRKSLADTYGWGRTSVAKAMAELVDAGWLALREYQNEDGHRLFEEFHVHVSRCFTQEELAVLGTTVAFGGRHVPDEGTPVPPFDAGGCTEPSHEHVLGRAIKEHQPEHHSEHQSVEHYEPRTRLSLSGRCYGCATSDTGRCDQHASQMTSMAEL